MTTCSHFWRATRLLLGVNNLCHSASSSIRSPYTETRRTACPIPLAVTSFRSSRYLLDVYLRHTVADIAVMSAAEADDTQSALGDGGGGPGAPTPLSVLDVCRIPTTDLYLMVLNARIGCRRFISPRYQACGRRRVQYSRVCGIYVWKSCKDSRFLLKNNAVLEEF